jgi:simple sugar transport system permease protein/ribose transport system permease protein
MSDTVTAAAPTTAGTAPGGPRRRGPRLARMRDLALVRAIVVLVVVGALIDPVFLTTANIVNVLQQQTELSLLVLAEAIILIGGRFDLSLESTVGLAPALAVALVIPAPATASAPSGRVRWRSRSAC